MIADPSFIDLDDLTDRLLVTHRLLLQCREAVNPESAKDLDVIPDRPLFMIAPNRSSGESWKLDADRNWDHARDYIEGM